MRFVVVSVERREEVPLRTMLAGDISTLFFHAWNRLCTNLNSDIVESSRVRFHMQSTVDASSMRNNFLSDFFFIPTIYEVPLLECACESPKHHFSKRTSIACAHIHYYVSD